MERTDSPRASEKSPIGFEQDPDWTKISYEDWPSDFVPAENGQQEAWGAGGFGISEQIVKDFQTDLESSGYKRKGGTDWFFIHPKKAKAEWEKFKRKRLRKG